MGDTKGLQRIHQMSEAFVKHRTKEFLTAFLKDSGIADELYAYYLLNMDTSESRRLKQNEFFDHLLMDLGPSYGQGIGLAYALGYADHLQGKMLQELYIVAGVKNPDGEQLTLPGVLD